MVYDDSYEVPPARLGRSSHHRTFGIAAFLVIFLGVVVAKPWAGSEPVERLARADASAVETAGAVPPSDATSRAGTVLTAPEATPPWPATSPSAPTTAVGPSQAVFAAASGSLADHHGTWGIGDGGTGPRLDRDEPWLDWQDVVPEAASDFPGRIATWPDTEICDRLPVLLDRPSFVAVTGPTTLDPHWGLQGWWSDGGRVVSLAGSVRRVSPLGIGGVTYVERLDGRPWPDGRYEFHVVASGSTLGLMFCLAETG